jgi:hypothetical protein
MVLEAGGFEPFWSNGSYRQPGLAKDSCGCLASVDILCAWSNMGRVAGSDGQKIG